MKDDIQAIRRCNATKPEPISVPSRQYGYISILNMAILMALGVLLYIGFTIFSGFSFEGILPYSSNQEINTSLPDPDKRINTDSSSTEVIYSSYEPRGVSNATRAQDLKAQSNNRRQSQLSATDNSIPAEQHLPDKHHDKTSPVSSPVIANNRSSKPQDRRPQARQQNRADNNPENLGSYGTFVIAGQVLDETGWPVPSIEVIAVVSRLFDDQAALSLSPGMQVQSAITNNSGIFQLLGLAEGEYKIHTAISDYYPIEASTISRTGIDNLKLVVIEQRKALLFGQVESSSGKPLPGVEVVSLSDPDQTAFTDQDGYYNLAINVKRNSGYAVQFWADGYQEKILRINSTETHGVNEIERNIALLADKNLTTVAGSLSSAGSPVSGERVYLKSSTTKRKYDGITDKSGKFIIPNIEIGENYILWVSPKGPYELYRQNNVVVPANGLHNLAISLQPEGLGSLTGQMIDLDGNPIPNFSLFLRSKSSTSSHITVTGNTAGYFTAENVPKGELTLGTSSLPKLSVSGIELQEGTEKEVTLILDIGGYQLHGQVTDTHGNPVPAASVILIWVYRDNGITYESIHKSVSTSSGDFLFSQLGPGKRTLTIAAPGYETTKIPYEVGMSTEHTISVQLEPKIGG